MKTYLETLLTGCLGSDTDLVVQLEFAYRIGSLTGKNRRGKDRDILMMFSERTIKTLILDHLWDSPKILLEGQESTFYSDLCPITIQRRKEWRFFTSKLIVGGIPYKWGYPFKLLIDYKGQTLPIKTLHQARQFCCETDSEEVEVLNASSYEKGEQHRNSVLYRLGGDPLIKK